MALVQGAVKNPCCTQSPRSPKPICGLSITTRLTGFVPRLIRSRPMVSPSSSTSNSRMKRPMNFTDVLWLISSWAWEAKTTPTPPIDWSNTDPSVMRLSFQLWLRCCVRMRSTIRSFRLWMDVTPEASQSCSWEPARGATLSMVPPHQATLTPIRG